MWRLNFSDKMRPLILLNVNFRSAAEMAQQRIVRAHARVLASELRPYSKRLVEHFRASSQAGSGYN